MASATEGSRSSRAETKFAGVVLFGQSLEDLKVVKWACQHLPVSDEYRLCVIHVTELKKKGTNPTPPASITRYGKYDELEGMLKNAGYPHGDIADLQYSIVATSTAPKKMSWLQKKDVKQELYRHIWGVECKGENFERTLQGAISNPYLEGLDMLVLRWSEPDDPQGTPIKRLKSNGCSIVLANVEPSTSKVLTLAVEPSPGEWSVPTPAGATTAPLMEAGSTTTPPAPPPTATGKGSVGVESAGIQGRSGKPKNLGPKKNDDATSSSK